MRQSAATLETFYATKLGQAAAHLMRQRCLDLWGTCTGKSILGIGFPTPLLPLWQANAQACIGVIPGEIGETRLAGARGETLALSPEHRLPFADASFDRIVMLHALEEADSPRSLMREAWRLLAPEGRIVIATANRKSFWSVTDGEAFGHGRPWTRRQLMAFMTDNLFQVTASTTAVHMPPLNWPIITAAAKSWERVGELITPGLGGVVLVEATKRLYAKPGGSAPAAVTKAVKASNGSPALPRKQASKGTNIKSNQTPD